MEKDIFSCLEEKAPAFSKGQKSIANYIQENREQAAFLTAAKIAKAVGVSESTVVRFALELGYSGYPEMQKALQEKVLRKLSPDAPEEQPDGIAASFYRDLTGLTKTRDMLDRNLLVSAAEVIARAGKVYLHGCGQAAALGELLKNALLQMRSGVYLLGSDDPQTLCRELLDGEDGGAFLELRFPGDSGSAASQIARTMGYVTVVFGGKEGDYPFPCAFGQEDGVLIPMSLLGAVHAFLRALWDIRQDAIQDRAERAARFLRQEAREP